MLEIRLLGELEVERDGQAVPLPASKKSRALLAYLAATARPICASAYASCSGKALTIRARPFAGA
jgi:hypothetical protein